MRQIPAPMKDASWLNSGDGRWYWSSVVVRDSVRGNSDHDRVAYIHSHSDTQAFKFLHHEGVNIGCISVINSR